MTAPRWAAALLRLVAPPGRVEELLGDFEEAHRNRVDRQGVVLGWLLTAIDTMDMAMALLRQRFRNGHRTPVRPEHRGTYQADRTRWVSLLDLKLAFRMLIKYPGLTVVGGLGMAIAIAFSAGTFSVIYMLMEPDLPLDEGDRVVSIQTWDARAGRPFRQSLHDLATWREELRTFQDVGAFTLNGRNLVTEDGHARRVQFAVMTASGFRVARVPPLIGRYLRDEDEARAAPPVAVLGYDLWRDQFQSDADVLGQTIRLGDDVHTVVGVMPEGFLFPLNQALWLPFQLSPLDYERAEGPDLFTFGRLASGFAIEDARAELTAVSRRMATAFPDTHEHLRPEVMPYTWPFVEIDTPGAAWLFHSVVFLVTLLLVVVSVNVAVLVYARTAMRGAEIAVRTALGASRRRVVMQLFVEAVVLSTGAALVGVVIAHLALRQLTTFVAFAFGDFVPFWFDLSLSPSAMMYSVGIAIGAAVIVGMLPGIQATGPSVQAGLQRLAGGGACLKLGGTWTALIVTQVAIAVAVLPVAVFGAWDMTRLSLVDPGYAAEEFLTARVSRDVRTSTPLAIGKNLTPSDQKDESARLAQEARYQQNSTELVRRLEVDAGLTGVTFSRFGPGREPTAWIEVEGMDAPAEASRFGVHRGTAGHYMRFNQVDVDYFEVFDVPVQTGRSFMNADVDQAATAVVVNRTFVDRVLGGGEALGRRVRYVGLSGDAPQDMELGRWYEIVGVVRDFPFPPSPAHANSKVYNPIAPGDLATVNLALRVRGGETAGFGERLREISAAVDPTLQIFEVRPMDFMIRQEHRAMRMVALAVGVGMLSVVLLSAAGIYAMMSFTVTQRRREIGIRAALGAGSRRILVSIFTRAAWQLAVGVAVGMVLAVLLDLSSGGEMLGGEAPILLTIASLFMLAVGLGAALGPARRGLEIEPAESLQAE